MVLRKTITEIVILGGVAVTLALLVNTISPKGIALVGQWDTSKGVVTAGANSEGGYRFPEIDRAPDAKKIFDKGNVLFVDARSVKDYENGHIPGAVSLPPGQFDERIGSFLDRHPPDRPIVVYCSGRTCHDSHDLARMLSDLAFSDVRIFIDGFPGWQAQGYPIE